MLYEHTEREIAFEIGGGSLELAGIGTPSDFKIFESVDIQVPAGEFIAIIGPSGCGKSSLLNVLAGELALTKGQLRFPRTKKRPRVAALWQEDQLVPWRTSKDNVALPLEIGGSTRRQATREAHEWMGLVGLQDFQDVYPAQLSGGMRKRVALATALAAKPDLLLLDEPFGALDHWTKQEIGQELLRLWEIKKPTIVLVTHAADEAIGMANQVIVLSKRPARIHAVYENPLPRPRQLANLYLDSTFHEQVRILWKLLKEASA